MIHESLDRTRTTRSTRGRRCGTRCSTSRASEEQVGRNAAIWAHLTKEAPALLAKMIMHGALEGTHNIEVELARRLGVPETDALPDVMMRVTLAAVQSAYLRWLDDDGAASLADLTADALDLVGAGLAHDRQITLRPYSSFHQRAFATTSGSAAQRRVLAEVFGRRPDAVGDLAQRGHVHAVARGRGEADELRGVVDGDVVEAALQHARPCRATCPRGAGSRCPTSSRRSR